MGSQFKTRPPNTWLYPELARMSLDVYTNSIPLTQKAQFWSTYISALKGAQSLRAPEIDLPRVWHSSLVDSLSNDFSDLKDEFGKLETQMFSRDTKRANTPLTPVLPGAHDRIFSSGYRYLPIHNQIYGSFEARTARVS